MTDKSKVQLLQTRETWGEKEVLLRRGFVNKL